MQGSEAIKPENYAVQQGMKHLLIGSVIGQHVENRTMTFQCSNATVAVQFLNDHLVRVKLTRAASVSLAFGPMIDTRVVDETCSVEVQDTETETVLKTSALQVRVEKAPFRLSVLDSSGRVIMEDHVTGWTEKNVAFCAKKRGDENFYGWGEKTGHLNKKGDKTTMWNTDVYAPHNPEIEALYQSIPFFIATGETRTHGLFLDEPGKSEFFMNEPGTYRFQAENGELDYYFLDGPTMKDVVQRFADLTGKMPLPPKWAIGYHQSRYSYETEEEVRALANTFREKEIPCDVIYLDIHYMNEYRVFTWHPMNFPEPKQLLSDLREQGFRIVPIVDPGVKKDPQYAIYQEGVREDHFCKYIEGEMYTGVVWPGESALPDFTNEKTRLWWGDKHAGYIEAGIEGIWNDMNEPAIFNETKTMDVNVMHGNDGQPKTHGELHNLYGLYMSGATYDGLKRHLQGNRPFVLTRAGYAGIQKYAAVWTGDNRSFWEHLQMSIPQILNMGLSGIPFAGADVGGFAYDTNGELLTRWVQVGAFLPYFRNHSAIGFVRQEPWSFGETHEAVIKKFIDLRYHFLPHLYTLFQQASVSGLPIVRPLVLEYPQDSQTFNLEDEFLFGDSILVAPILTPGTEHRAVYLPEGQWVNYWTGETLNGGQHVLAHAPLDTMPLYVKAGAIYAAGSRVQHTGEQQAITFHVFPGSGSYTFYEDNGLTFEFEQGAYNELKIDQQQDGDTITLGWAYAHKGYDTGEDTLRFQFQHVHAPTQVQGLGSTHHYDETTRTLTVELPKEAHSLSVTF